MNIECVSIYIYSRYVHYTYEYIIYNYTNMKQSSTLSHNSICKKLGSSESQVLPKLVELKCQHLNAWWSSNATRQGWGLHSTKHREKSTGPGRWMCWAVDRWTWIASSSTPSLFTNNTLAPIFRGHVSFRRGESPGLWCGTTVMDPQKKSTDSRLDATSTSSMIKNHCGWLRLNKHHQAANTKGFTWTIIM